MAKYTWTKADWDEEREYILSVDPMHPSENFNGQPEVFKSYCDMQANSASREGFITHAADIREHGTKTLEGQDAACPSCGNKSVFAGGYAVLCRPCTVID